MTATNLDDLLSLAVTMDMEGLPVDAENLRCAVDELIAYRAGLEPSGDGSDG